ncbi:MAG: hypothetical protein ACFCBV_02600 [Phycisphaerales bacterium]|nr:hypothetical protein [Phycisphaerales bacterium]
MLSGLGQSEGLVERVLALAGGSDAAWLAGIAVVVGMMLWSAGARAVSLAFAAAGGTAGLYGGFMLAQHVQIPEVAGLPGSLIAGAAGAGIGVVVALLAMRLVISAAAGATAATAAAGLAVLFAPHLPLDGVAAPPTPQVAPSSPTAIVTPEFQPVAWSTPANPWTTATEPTSTDAEAEPTTPSTITTEAIVAQAERAWARVPSRIQGEAMLAILACGLCGALLGAIWPARIASATTAFMGAAIWPLGALHMQSIAGTPLPIDDVPAQTWIVAWIALGLVGLGIQRLVVRRVAES